MNITIDQIIVWLIVGGLAGALTGMVVKRDRVGFGQGGREVSLLYLQYFSEETSIPSGRLSLPF